MNLRLTSIIALVVAFSGCGSADPVNGGIDGPVVFAARSDGAEEALIEGVIEIDGDCVFLNAGTRVAVVWPNGTTWHPENESIRPSNGPPAANGKSISTGGGYHSVDALEAFVTDPAALERLRSCGADEVAVIQGDSLTVSDN